eukprot:CAMPEP_0181317532 /NCGR_PEP_ID=MMETSP1101-20121128/16520_1 /TAXON_ID=46948 /ORGANISM="Rhodomonas abbreviata, Strain Caron Lab Isolate" /LENGTH=360 /DNA_ID=CAMNT_0023424935 /DNA_START=1 /DNA_END=1083 /DNA_ORIENTATION=-
MVDAEADKASRGKGGGGEQDRDQQAAEKNGDEREPAPRCEEGEEDEDMHMSQCYCCPGSKCEFLDYDEVFGTTGVTQHRLHAPAYSVMVVSFSVFIANLCQMPGGTERIGSHGPTLQILMESLQKDVPPTLNSSRLTALEVLMVAAHVINLRTPPGLRLVPALAEALDNSMSLKRAFVELPVCVIARLSECSHNKQVLHDNESQIVPQLLRLLKLPRSPGLLTAVLDALVRLCQCGPMVPRRMQRTKGVVKELVMLAGSRFGVQDDPGKPGGRDRTKAARILLKIAEDPGGIACLQEHEAEIVDLLANNTHVAVGAGDNGDTEELRNILGSLMHALVPTEAPYIKALELYDPLPIAMAAQ